MKKITAALLLLAAAGLAGASVTDSKHNLSTSSTNGVRATNQDQLCLFCHTPHNPMQMAPLWNRKPPTDPQGVRLFVPSETLSAAGQAGQLDSSHIGWFCLSCHGEPLQQLGNLNVLPPGYPPIEMIDANGTWDASGVRWDGASVSNHPTGFDYVAAQAAKPTRLKPLDASITSLLPMYRSNLSTTTMECATCHKVHDDTNRYFMRVPDQGNNLCLTCHVM